MLLVKTFSFFRSVGGLEGFHHVGVYGVDEAQVFIGGKVLAVPSHVVGDVLGASSPVDPSVDLLDSGQ